MAIMLGRLKMSVEECIDQYLKLSENIFQSRGNALASPIRKFKLSAKFDALKLEESVVEALESCGLKEDELLEEVSPKCKV
jgi:hypothetical protein